MKLTIVHVEWIDSQSTNGWEPVNEISGELEHSHSIGILAKETDSFIVIAHSCDPQTESYNGVITIPKSAISKMKTIKHIKR